MSMIHQNDFLRLPEPIRKGCRFCCWRKEHRNGTDTKVPYTPTSGNRAKSNDVTTFRSFEQALAAYNNSQNTKHPYSGLGICVDGNIGAIDIDHCLDADGNLNDVATAVLGAFKDCYFEVSPSGSGLRGFFQLSQDFKYDTTAYYTKNSRYGLEIYLPGYTNRFVTTTGNMYREGDVSSDMDALQLILDSFMLRVASDASDTLDVTRPLTSHSYLTDEQVLAKASASNPRFKDLYEGKWQEHTDKYPSQSEADMAFASMLAFWCGRDFEQMNRIFESSGLYREKWDRAQSGSTYGAITLENAINRCTETYCPTASAADDFAVMEDEEDYVNSDAEDAGEAAKRQNQIDTILSSEITIDAALSPQLLSLAAWAYLHDMTRYVKLKNQIPKAVGIRIFEREVQKVVKSNSTKTLVQLLTLSGVQTQGMLVPENWVVNDSGIRHMEMVMGELKPVLFSAEPLFVSAKLVNVDDTTEKLEITFRRNSKYKTLVAPRADMLNKNTIICYADAGLPVSSGTAGTMTKYIAEMEAANAHVIPIRRAIRRAGWVGDEFYPYSMKDGIVAQTDGNETERLLAALQKSGSEEAWLSAAAKVREMPFARAMLAASFASPLLEKLHHRNIYVHIWYSSRSGKTAVLKLAMSIWGDPRILVSKYFSTIVGMERTAGTLKHLPYALDELQTLNQKRLPVNDVVYTLGNGVGKTRGRVGDGIQKIEEWRNCILSTGEQPMSADNSMDGVNTRLMELYACPLNKDGIGAPDDALGRELHQVAETNYGFAGETYIRWMIPHLDRLQKDYTTFVRALESKNVQQDNIAVLALADYYSSIAVFGFPEDRAYAEAVALGELLLKNQEDNAPKDSIESAWEFLCGWIASNKVHFCGSTGQFDMPPVYGKAEKNAVYVIASVMNEALEEAGFSARKCIKGFQERNQIETFKDSQGKVRSQTTMKIKGTPVKVYALNIGIEDEPDETPALAEVS